MTEHIAIVPVEHIAQTMFNDLDVYMFMIPRSIVEYIYIYIYIHTYLYIYIYRERERYM